MSRKEKASAPAACPCGGGLDYEACCGRYHAGAPAPSAETLMRSRYSAYVLGLEPYLLATWHADTRPAALNLAADVGRTRWLGLKLLRQEASDADHALVEFVARFRLGGDRAQRLHECSRFLREQGRWYYVDGEIRA